MHATSATPTSSSETPANVAGSVGVTPHNCDAMSRVSASAPARPHDESAADERQRPAADERDDLDAAGAERAANADLARALTHRVRHHAVGADRREQRRRRPQRR